VDVPLTLWGSAHYAQGRLFAIAPVCSQGLFFDRLSKRSIARRLGLSLWFVSAWTKSPTQDLTLDRRGWMKGRTRTYSQRDEQRVLKIHAALQTDPERLFAGASAIERRYRELYADQKPLSLRFIGRTLAKHGLATLLKVRRKGVSRYLHYPQTLINGLGQSLVEVDFIGKKFITGRTQPVNFLAFSLRFPRQLKHFQRVEAETADEVKGQLQRFFRVFETPRVVKLDNGFAFAGAGPEPRTLNSLVLWLLDKQIIPVFIAPRKPWNQGSVEGANSIFSRKFWNQHRFRSPTQIDRELERFNTAYAWYTGYQKPKRSIQHSRRFVPRVYFIRKVYEQPDTTHGYIEVLKGQVTIPKAYINLFVLAEWNLKTEKLTILFEQDNQEHKLKSVPFALNPGLKKKVYWFH
jgi:hypothetical protein